MSSTQLLDLASHELLASAQQIAHLWPAAASDVTSLIIMLVTAPSLASLLTLKLVVLMTPSASAVPACWA